MGMRNPTGDCCGLLLIKNTTGETIPARSFVRVAPFEKLPSGTWVVIGEKPDDSDDAIYVVSGNSDIENGKTGSGYWPTEPVWVKYGNAPEPVTDVGPEEGEWICSSEGTGFSCVGVDTDSESALVCYSQGRSGATVEGYLKSDLGSEMGSTAMLAIWKPDVSSSSDDDGGWGDTGDTATVTNRDKALMAFEGDYVVAQKINGEWRPIWVSCDTSDEEGEV